MQEGREGRKSALGTARVGGSVLRWQPPNHATPGCAVCSANQLITGTRWHTLLSESPPAHGVSGRVTGLQEGSIRHPQLHAVRHCRHPPLVHRCCRLLRGSAATGRSRRCYCRLGAAVCTTAAAAAVPEFCFCILLPVAVAEGVLCQESIVCCPHLLRVVLHNTAQYSTQ
jgi:hypothetical protein